MGAIQRMSTNNGGNLMMDLDTSLGKNNSKQEEDTIEDLIRKLNQKGTKVKVLKDGEENIQTPGTGKQKSKKINNQADKENLHKGGDGAAAGGPSDKDHEKDLEQI